MLIDIYIHRQNGEASCSGGSKKYFSCNTQVSIIKAYIYALIFVARKKLASLNTI